MSATAYPRFLGVDGSGDFVWELANGRWTWGNDPHDANGKDRTFEPERYIEKYGRPVGLTEHVDRKAEADLDPAQVALQYVQVPDTGTREADKLAGVVKVLTAMREAVVAWTETGFENHQANDHRGESTPCWEQFHADDVRTMINDVARQLGVALGEVGK